MVDLAFDALELASVLFAFMNVVRSIDRGHERERKEGHVQCCPSIF